jgi:hypothetical protein
LLGAPKHCKFVRGCVEQAVAIDRDMRFEQWIADFSLVYSFVEDGD